MSKACPVKAITSGTIFGGLVDVYRLEDGSITISGRGAVRAITAGKDGKSGPANETPLGRYLDRLPKEYRHVATMPTTRIILPQGGLADSISPESMLAIIQAYADAFMDDENGLHPSQMHLGKTCIRLLKALSSVGIQKMCEEAVGIVRPNAELLFGEAWFRDKPLDAPAWSDSFVRQYCRWNGFTWKPGERHPFSMRSMNGFFYRMIFPTQIVDVIHEKGIEAACRLHQILTDKPRTYLLGQLEVALAIAQSCISETQWRRRMRAFYGKDENLSWDFE